MFPAIGHGREPVCWESGTGQGMPLLCPAHLHGPRMWGCLRPSLPSPPAFGHLNWEQLVPSLLVAAPPTSAACVDAASRNAACRALLPCPRDGQWELVPKPSHPWRRHRYEAPRHQSLLHVQSAWRGVFKRWFCCALTSVCVALERAEGRGSCRAVLEILPLRISWLPEG